MYEKPINRGALVSSMELLQLSRDPDREDASELISGSISCAHAVFWGDAVPYEDFNLRGAVILYLERYPEATIAKAVEDVCEFYGYRTTLINPAGEEEEGDLE